MCDCSEAGNNENDSLAMFLERNPLPGIDGQEAVAGFALAPYRDAPGIAGERTSVERQLQARIQKEFGLNPGCQEMKDYLTVGMAALEHFGKVEKVADTRSPAYTIAGV